MNSLLVNSATLEELIRLNAGPVVSSDSFLINLLSSSQDRSLGEACRLIQWYEAVFGGREGERVRDIPLLSLGELIQADAEAAVRIIESDIDRFSYALWLDGSESLPTVRLHRRPVPPLPRSCVLSLSDTGCDSELIEAIELLKSGTHSSVSAVARAVGLTMDQPEWACMHRALHGILGGVSMRVGDFRALLRINQASDSEPLSHRKLHREYRGIVRESRLDRCQLHRWYFAVLNPRLGERVTELGLRIIEGRVVPDAAAVASIFASYLPSAQDPFDGRDGQAVAASVSRKRKRELSRDDAMEGLDETGLIESATSGWEEVGSSDPVAAPRIPDTVRAAIRKYLARLILRDTAILGEPVDAEGVPEKHLLKLRKLCGEIAARFTVPESTFEYVLTRLGLGDRLERAAADSEHTLHWFRVLFSLHGGEAVGELGAWTTPEGAVVPPPDVVAAIASSILKEFL